MKFLIECLLLSFVIVLGLLGAKYILENVFDRDEIPTYEVKTIR